MGESAVQTDSKETFAKEFLEATVEMYNEWLDYEGIKALPDYEDALERARKEGLVPS